MTYKFSETIRLLAVTGCVLVAGSLATTVQQSSNGDPTALTVQAQSCCRDTDVLSTVHRECFNHSGNSSYPLQLNCSQYYIIYQEVETEVHVDAKGKLVENDYEVDWER